MLPLLFNNGNNFTNKWFECKTKHSEWITNCRGSQWVLKPNKQKRSLNHVHQPQTACGFTFCQSSQILLA